MYCSYSNFQQLKRQLQHTILTLPFTRSFYARKQQLLSARLIRRNSVRPSVCHTGRSVKNGAR